MFVFSWKTKWNGAALQPGPGEPAAAGHAPGLQGAQSVQRAAHAGSGAERRQVRAGDDVDAGRRRRHHRLGQGPRLVARPGALRGPRALPPGLCP